MVLRQNDLMSSGLGGYSVTHLRVRCRALFSEITDDV